MDFENHYHHDNPTIYETKFTNRLFMKINVNRKQKGFNATYSKWLVNFLFLSYFVLIFTFYRCLEKVRIYEEKSEAAYSQFFFIPLVVERGDATELRYQIDFIGSPAGRKI